MRLSGRLLALAGLVTDGSRLADIGTDHGYVPIYLVEQGRIPSAIAMDINPGPLNKANEHILSHGLSDRIVTRLSDGLTRLKPGEVDTVLIAGMGGALMSRILLDGTAVLEGVSELILQPQSEIAAFRHFLHDHAYRIIHEHMLVDEGKFYVMMKAIHGAEHYDREIFYIYGKKLLEQRDEVLYAMIRKELSVNEAIACKLGHAATENARERLALIDRKIKYGREALDYYELQTTDPPA